MNRSRESILREFLGYSPQRRDHLPYPSRTDDCPSLICFPAGVRDGWGDQREHVSRCDYCQHRTAKQWLFTPPRVLDVARYLAGVSPDEQAMRIYLAWPDGQRGRHLLKSGYVRALSELLRAAAAADSTIALWKGLAGQLAEFATGPALASRSMGGLEWRQRLEPLGGAQAVAVETPAQEADSYTVTLDSDGPLTVVLKLVDESTLAISASARSDHSERRVRVEILSEDGDGIQRDLTLQERDGDIAQAEELVELFAARVGLAKATILVSWIS